MTAVLPRILAVLLVSFAGVVTACDPAPGTSAPALSTRAGALTADRFQVPLNPPTGSGYNTTAGWGWVENEGSGVYHPGEDWNGNGGGDSDKGDSVYAIGSGVVTAADAYGEGWGNIVIIRHTLPSGDQVYSQYAHLDEISVSVGDEVAIGAKVGTIGKGHKGEYAAHLHLEVRIKDLPATNWPKAKAKILEGYVEPSVFIKEHEEPIEPCALSATGLTFIEETDGCVERGGKHWWDADGSGGHSFTTYTTADADPDSYAKWYLGVEQAGDYVIEVFIPDLPGLSKHARYKLWLPGEQWVEVDQSAHRGELVSLGTMKLSAGAALRLNDNTGEPYVGTSGPKLAVDAVRITPAANIGYDPSEAPDAGASAAPGLDATGGAPQPAIEAGQSGGCAANAGPDGAWALAAMAFLLALRAARRSRIALALALVLLGPGCERGTDWVVQDTAPPGSDFDEDNGTVTIDGIERQLVPSALQTWGDLPESYWAEAPIFGPELPQKVNHAAFQTPVRDQQGQTCVDYAVVAGIEAVTHFANASSPDVSEAHLGASHGEPSLKETLLAAQSTKLTTEEYWPIGASAPKSGWEQHREHGIEKFQAIANPADIDVLRAHLAEGDDTDIILALNVVGSSWANTGAVEPPLVANAGVGAWAHAVLLVGYERRKNYDNKDRWFFRFKNSWGISYGTAGYGWLSEDYVKDYVLAAAIVRKTVMPGAPTTACGDGVCSGAETCKSCSTDCKCLPGTACSSAGTCAPTESSGCTDGCTTPSEAACASQTSVTTCKKGGDGCYDWVTTACETGRTCLDGECVSVTKPKDCTSGACCTAAGAFEPSTKACDPEADVEYGCPFGTACGDDAGTRVRPRYCSGQSAGCSGSLGPWKAWTKAESCAATETCNPATGTCKLAGACSEAQCTCGNGPCCDGCELEPAGTPCAIDAESEVSCPWGTACGASVGARSRDRLCNGATSACAGSFGAWKSWVVQDSCGSDETCAMGDSTCNYTSGCDTPVCECTSGPCCDGCHYRSGGTVCATGAETELGCPWGTGCGDDVGTRSRDRTCSGWSASCDGPYAEWDGWAVKDACSGTETCSAGASTCGYSASCDTPTCECTSGSCCDGCSFRSSGWACDDEWESGCPWGTGCGDDAGERTRPRYCSGSSASCSGSWGSWSSWSTLDSCSASQVCSSGSCSTSTTCGTKCGNGSCESTETPKTCSSDCGDASFAITPSVYYGNSPSSVSLSCSSSASTAWHKGASGQLPYWVFASNCGVPSTSSPSSYAGYNARWTFSIKKSGTYDVAAWIPDQANACSFGSDKLSQEVHYILTGTGGTKKQANVSQKANMGSSLPLFTGVSLPVGSFTLYLYDDAWGGCACNGSGCSSTSTRVFADTVGVNFKG